MNLTHPVHKKSDKQEINKYRGNFCYQLRLHFFKASIEEMKKYPIPISVCIRLALGRKNPVQSKYFI